MPLLTGPLPRYAGLSTYCRAPYADVEALRPGMIAVAGVTYDLSCTGMIGARYGPRQIREASMLISMVMALDPGGIIDSTTRVPLSQGPSLAGKVVDVGDFNEYQTDWPKTEAAVRRSMWEVVRRGVLTVVFGGDHLNSYPLVLGFRDAMKENGKTVGYIQFSSQLDLGDKDPLWGAAWRGSTAKRILDSGALSRANMVWVGTSGYLPRDQTTMAKELNLNVFTAADVRRDGIERVTRQALERAGDGCDAVYVSIDLDVLDGVYVQSMSIPTFEGLTSWELDRAMDLFAVKKVRALDITGCNPMPEYRAQGRLASQLTAWLAFRFMMRASGVND